MNRPRLQRLVFQCLATLLGGVLLAGCASVRVDSEVTAFSKLPPARALSGGYRFEQLPSQQAQATRQAQVEAVAQSALQRVGLVREDNAARYSVQVVVGRVQIVRSGWDDTFGWRPGYGPYGWGPAWRTGFGPWPPFYGPAFAPNPLYRHELTVLLRDLSSQQVVFESKAVHEGLWASADLLLPALIEAALRDFPTPPAGVRRVEVELPR